MHFVITGTPRSATKYSSKLLSELGAPCSHERVLRPETSVVNVLRWLDQDDVPGESSWMAWTVLPLLPEPIPVLHVIRDPWLVIDSLANRNSILDVDQMKTKDMLAIRDMLKTYLPDVLSWPNRIDQAASFVLGWNRLIALAHPDRFVFYPDRLDLRVLRGMLHHVGIERTDKDLIVQRDRVSTAINKGYTVNDITELSDPVVARAIEEYAKNNGFTEIFARQIVDKTEYQTPEEVAEAMAPDLLEQVNEFAAAHGYQEIDVPQLVSN